MKKAVKQVDNKVEEKVQITELVLNIEVAQEVLTYLSSRPYAEVAKLIKDFQGSKLQ